MIDQPSAWSTTLYINDVPHLITNLEAPEFYADAPGFPRTRCSRHLMDSSSIAWLKSGGGVITSGNHYSLHPPREKS